MTSEARKFSGEDYSFHGVICSSIQVSGVIETTPIQAGIAPSTEIAIRELIYYETDTVIFTNDGKN